MLAAKVDQPQFNEVTDVTAAPDVSGDDESRSIEGCVVLGVGNAYRCSGEVG
jgi:hypothetical protein